MKIMFLFRTILFWGCLFIFCAKADHNKVSGRDPTLNFETKSKEKNLKLPPCKSCTILIDSFRKGLDKTNRGKHDGGDAAWEEEKLRNYKTSEVRLVEIQEMLCTDITQGQNQCLTLANENEELIEDWWFNHQENNPDIFKWLCIEKLEVCCPLNHFGSNCQLCDDCNGNGKCKGNGTRKGNGKCLCDKGYIGGHCNECDSGFYEAFKDDTKLLCSPCHRACSDAGCIGSGPKKCKSCREGWILNSESGCFDVNECLDSSNDCNENQFCINNEGSYSCLECDRSCKGCIGDGPDMCKKCAENFELKDGKCIDVTGEKRDQFVNLTRFLTYLGLCIATCAISQSSPSVAYIVGVAVAVYIGASEYWLNTNPTASPSPSIDTKQLEDMIRNSL